MNAEREAEGLSPLRIEAHLNASAQSQSDWMAETGRLSHDGEDGSNVADRIAGTGFPVDGSWRAAENLAYVGVTGEPGADELERAHEGLMASPGHRANILDPDMSYVGVGLSTGAVAGGRGEAVFVTQNFAETDGRVLVQEETGDGTALQPYEDGAPVGEPQIVRPDPPEEKPEEEEEEAGSAGGGGCFVATAAYGDRRHPEVVALRRFRDAVLARRRAGRVFIRLYGIVGPRLAGVVAHDRPSGRAARAVLGPLARWLGRRR